MPKTIKKWVVGHDLFQGYRYKKRKVEINPDTGKLSVFQPYIPCKESSNHEFSLTYDEWLKVVETYFNVVTEETYNNGKIYEFPRNIGRLEMQSYKSNFTKFRNFPTMKLRPRIVWFRNFIGAFKKKRWYTFNLSRKKQWTIIGKILKENPSSIFNLNRHHK